MNKSHVASRGHHVIVQKAREFPPIILLLFPAKYEVINLLGILHARHTAVVIRWNKYLERPFNMCIATRDNQCQANGIRISFLSWLHIRVVHESGTLAVPL